MNKYVKLILWIVISSFLGGATYGFLDALGLARTAEFWKELYHMIIGVGIGYFIFKD